MKLARVVASLAFGSLLYGCAVSEDPGGVGSGFVDSGSTGFDASGDGVGKDTGVASDSSSPAKDSGTPGVDSGTKVDSGTPGSDTGSTADTDPGIDSDLPDTAVEDTALPPSDAPPGTCTVDADCTGPLTNCCDTTSGKCSIFWLIVCLPVD